MEFTKLQMSAIVKMAKSMVMADGVVNEKETELMSKELLRFGVPFSEVPSIMKMGDNMQASDAVTIISAMDSQQKKYVTAYLGVMIAIDGDIDDSEMKLWTLISVLCNLPTMTIKEAASFLANF